MTNEEWYDQEVAPVLKSLGEQCLERGMALVSVVEYESGSRGNTIFLSENAGLAMAMLCMCACWREY